jgi:hypothetical protein
MRTNMKAGLAVATYVENGQGRRLLVSAGDHGYLQPVTLATNRREANDAIAALKQLSEELPP